jgi:16S rRNA (adenine1518-N6/adenine1519-N6)-dimethyltransferase
VEIGPGLGFLTEYLIQAGCVVDAYEIDMDMVNIMRQRFSSEAKLTVHQESALEYIPPSSPYKIVANIPYYLTSIFIERHLEEVENKPNMMVLMVQKEVAEEICAKPGKLSILGISVQTFGDVEFVRGVPRTMFHPVPKVDSAVIKITLKRSFEPEYLKAYFRLVKTAFHNKRKQLHNTLRGLDMTSEEVTAMLAELSIDSRRRPQELDINDWHRLTEYYINHENGRI